MNDQVGLSLEIRGLTSREESKETRKPMNRYVPQKGEPHQYCKTV